jgi:hypothetical protein
MENKTEIDIKAMAAFVRAQRKFAPALKTSSNPHFKSRYADLAQCVEAVMDGLHSEGLALLQTTHQSEGGVGIETILIHEEGGTISGGVLHVPATKQDAQGYGSAMTYARRYSLMATCGIAPEDDDGNAASKKAPARDAVAMVQKVKTLGELQATWAILTVSEKAAAEEAKNTKKEQLTQETNDK